MTIEVAKKYSDRLPELKKTVEEARNYFEENINRFHRFMKFVFKSSMNQQEMAALLNTGKPTVEFNFLESYISRQRGEFAKHEPMVQVHAADGLPVSSMSPQLVATIKVVEAHFKSIFAPSANDMLSYDVFTDLLAGGFSTVKVETEYVNEMSFEQNIVCKRVFDPTLCFFDPLARESHKGDGRYCGELSPMTRSQFEEQYGKDATINMRFVRSLSTFSWSFKNEEEDIILVCDLYEKKVKKEKIVKLSNGHTVTDREYKKFLEKWEQEGHIEQPPIIVNSRMTNIEKICRYRFCESKLLEYVETDFKYFPLVFVDGNSVMITEGQSSGQMTRPYVFHAEGIQKLKNFSGQCLGNELENMVQHKFVVAVESIPEDYQTAYQNVQKADTLLYNHFLDARNPEVVLPPPREIQRTPIPPEITNTFRMSDEMTQVILGNYDAGQVINRDNMSGIAFARSAIQSNTSATPYIVGYIKGINRVSQIILDLIPKYYRTPRSLPVLKPNGDHSQVMINSPGNIYMNFDPNSLQVKVEAGVNFAIQKEVSLNTMVQMMQASPVFAQFMNEHGLQILLDNIDVRGSEELKQKAAEFEKQMQQQRQQQAQAQMQKQQAEIQAMQQQSQVEQQKAQLEMQQFQRVMNSPTIEEIGLLSVQEKAKKDAADMAIKQQDSEVKFMETMAKIQLEGLELDQKQAQQEAENAREIIRDMNDLSDKFINLKNTEIKNEETSQRSS